MARERDSRGGPESLGAFHEDDLLNVVIEVPAGRRNKYAFDEETGMYLLKHVLPAGAVFPFDFGFIPSTLGGDGDPLDVLVLMDEPGYPGCSVRARLVGAIVAEQTEGEITKRNDRLIAVADASHLYKEVDDLDSLHPNTVTEIEHFFISYNAIKGRTFEPKKRVGPRDARRIVEEAVRTAESESEDTE